MRSTTILQSALLVLLLYVCPVYDLDYVVAFLSFSAILADVTAA